MIKKVLLFSYLVTTSAHALEIDEKLTLRFLKVSDSKKTVLINRGGEDGLVVGDHAKFFITAGVIARGVAEKVSPSRSIWSLYRVVDPNEITNDKVLNLKIASPVKITEDPTKSLKEEPIPGGSESMPLDEKTSSVSDDKEIVVDEADQAELEELGMEPKSSAKKSAPVVAKSSRAETSEEIMELPSRMGTNKADKWEVWGMLYLNSLSGESDTAGTTTDFTASAIDFSLGIERYFFNMNNFLRDFSVTGFVHKRTTETGGDVQSESDWLEFGGGLSYHFYNKPYDLNRPVFYGMLTAGIGSESNETSVSTPGVAPVTEEGDSNFFSLGLGMKYTLSNNFGARAIFDYYSSTETYEFNNGTQSERSLSGTRLQFGLSYRF